MNEWNIQARSHGCQGCGKGFADQQVYHTLLFDEKQELRRLDVCEPCWLGQYGQGASDRKGFISHWQGVYELPPPAAPEPIQKENAESLLRKLIELNDPRYSAAGFILAVMLERKRLLKVKEQFVRDGQRVFLYEQPHSGDLFTVPDPNLQLNQLEQVQRDVAALLEHGIHPPECVDQSAGGEAAPSSEAQLGDTVGAPGEDAPSVVAPVASTPPVGLVDECAKPVEATADNVQREVPAAPQPGEIEGRPPTSEANP